jgi:hypothetical protein
LSLGRFELVDGSVEPGVTEYRLLTLYQVADPGDADFSTPSYRQHTATYAPPPEGVTDGIAFERHVLRRRGVRSGRHTQPVGEACISLVGADGPWLQDGTAAASTSRLPVLTPTTTTRAHAFTSPGWVHSNRSHVPSR